MPGAVDCFFKEDAMNLATKTHRLSWPVLIGLLTLLLLASCGEAAKDSPSGGGSPSAVPAVVGDATRGAEVFKANGCNGCHTLTDQKLVGPGLKGALDGKGPYGANLPNGKPINDDNLKEWIKVGGIGKIGQMPGFSTLTEENIADLIAYLKTIK
jgi:mono/diheme cytochrome c family protein